MKKIVGYFFILLICLGVFYFFLVKSIREDQTASLNEFKSLKEKFSTYKSIEDFDLNRHEKIKEQESQFRKDYNFVVESFKFKTLDLILSDDILKKSDYFQFFISRKDKIKVFLEQYENSQYINSLKNYLLDKKSYQCLSENFLTQCDYFKRLNFFKFLNIKLMYEVLITKDIQESEKALNLFYSVYSFARVKSLRLVEVMILTNIKSTYFANLYLLSIQSSGALKKVIDKTILEIDLSQIDALKSVLEFESILILVGLENSIFNPVKDYGFTQVLFKEAEGTTPKYDRNLNFVDSFLKFTKMWSFLFDPNEEIRKLIIDMNDNIKYAKAVEAGTKPIEFKSNREELQLKHFLYNPIGNFLLGFSGVLYDQYIDKIYTVQSKTLKLQAMVRGSAK